MFHRICVYYDTSISWENVYIMILVFHGYICLT